MRIYFSGIGGVGIGPLAEIAADAGYDVTGSDLATSPLTEALQTRGIHVSIGQTGQEIAAAHGDKPIDWFVYTTALAEDHPELAFARSHGIHTSKRDELLAHIIQDKKLKLLAVSGTHGKTTTTGMLVWCFQQLNLPVSYSIGATLGFGPSGAYDPLSQYFVYECDEFDRNLLHFWPYLSLITSLDHDHFETYPTADDYRAAFRQFMSQSDDVLLWEKDCRYVQLEESTDYTAYDEQMNLSHITLAGDHIRHNAYLVEQAMRQIFPDIAASAIATALNNFPGTDRRFEKLADNLYSDYGHHPVEIAATLQLAHELADNVILVYQPHQNRRQHQLQYGNCFQLAQTVYFLPTYLSREDSSQAVLTPDQLIGAIHHPDIHAASLDHELWDIIESARQAGQLVLVMGAGSIDTWVRQQLHNK